jgi:maleylpyruvate isomerase
MSAPAMKLYGYFQSSAAFRVRIALRLKGLPADHISVNLLKDAHRADEFARLNPQQAVPTLVDGERVITQSLAIIEYLEERYPNPPLLPANAEDRARARSMALLIACDIHPLNNLRVLRYLKRQLGMGKEQRDLWYHHWLEQGLRPLEALLRSRPSAAGFCVGASPTLADVCLVPQIFNAQRSGFDLTPYPALMSIFGRCMQLDAFDKAQPAKQPDAE